MTPGKVQQTPKAIVEAGEHKHNVDIDAHVTALQIHERENKREHQSKLADQRGIC